MVTLPVMDSHRTEVRRTYRDWRKTHDRYDARAHATLTALWYTVNTHPHVSIRALW